MAGRVNAAYVRVSKAVQDTRSQLPDLQRWERAQDTATEWYTDHFTGREMARPEWDKLWARVESGNVQTIVVWRLDRLGRTAKGLATLFEDLIRRKVGLVSLRDGVDLSTPAGRLMAHVLASVAQYETEVRLERQLAGIAAAKAAGKRWGGRPKGLRVKVSADQIELIRRLKSEGKPILHIARALSLSRPTIYSVLNE